MSNANIGIVLNLTGIVEQPEAGVTSFKGRKGDVTPQTGDYTASQVGARPSTWTPTAADVGAVPATRKVNNKTLSADISLTASDVGAAASSHGTHVTYSSTAPKMDGTASVGTAGTVARSDHVHPTDTSRAAASHTHTKSQITDFPSSMPASDVSAWAKASAKPSYTAAEVGAVPTTRKVNNKALSADISLTASDISALPITGGTLTGPITISGKRVLIEGDVPTGGATGQVLKKKSASNYDTEWANAVTSFNGREGDVTAQAGDYTAHQVGALSVTGGTMTGTIVVPITSDSVPDFRAAGSYAKTSTIAAKFYRIEDASDTTKSYPAFRFTVAPTAVPEDESLVLKGIKTPVKDTDAANKKYVDNKCNGFAPKAYPEFTGSISLGRTSGTTIGKNSMAVGSYTEASGSNSHAEGSDTTASGICSHAEGSGTTASGFYSHAEGEVTTATAHCAHAEGNRTTASGLYSHAEGCQTTASGGRSHAEGEVTKASGDHSHAAGYYTVAQYESETVVGRYNVEKDVTNTSTLGDLFVVGKGTAYNARANAFRVSTAGVYGTSAFNASGADYAELFEWEDGNPNGEDRCGRFVTLHGSRICLAQPGEDFLLGIISGNPSVVGDVHDDQWCDMFLYDVFGRPIWEDVNVPDETCEEPDPENPGQTITRVIVPAHTERRQKLNPQYDSSQTYIPRSERSEWDAVGMMGKLVVLDDGSCQINGWCTAGTDGIATASENRSGWRVMERIDETHIRVLALQGG